MAPKRILVAGIGNIFFGDDAFGCEVAAELAKRSWPDGVSIVDFGIRAYDLAYAIMDGYDATILIDAAPRGEKPGTVYLLELDPNKVDTCGDEIVNAHALTPVRVLQLIAEGNSNKEIAAQLSLTEDGVKGQVRSILAKLGANDRAHAAVIGLKRGVI